MSYDLMVFDPVAAPRDRVGFLEWYQSQTEWREDHSYNDPIVTSPLLQAWYNDFSKEYRPLNGPGAVTDDELHLPKVTDYCIGHHIIYTGFVWGEAEEAFLKMKDSAAKSKIGFFNVSADQGEIVFPDLVI